MPRRDPWTYIGLIAFFALLFVALFGERIAPHEAIYFVPEHGRDPRPYDPGLVFPFGSDILGRDLFSLVLAGARLTLTIVLLGGLARVAAGLLLAIIAGWSRRSRPLIDQLSELVAAVPATLVVLLVVLVFVRGETTFLVFVGALLITGWAGPYRVFRTELDRLARMTFTEGAEAMGLGRLKILTRHHLPHLVPLVAMNASQQVVASLVALAELGVLGVFVGTIRAINIAASLGTVHEVGQINSAAIADPPEWGGLLANARTIDSLWTTRWLFLVPGIAFAITAVCIAAIGQSLARTFARRNLFDELAGRNARVLLAAAVGLVVVSLVVPERYPAARDWAATARGAVSTTDSVERAFADAGLVPFGSSYAVERDTTQVVRSGPATIRIGDLTLSESAAPTRDIRAFVDADTGGGHVDARLVFLGYGISPADYPSRALGPFGGADLGTTLADFGDAYHGIDVHGKIAIVVRFSAVHGDRDAAGPDIETAILNAKKHGAAAILFVDQDLGRYAPTPTLTAAGDPYTRLEALQPVASPDGTPVVVLSPSAADRLLAPFGIRPSALPRIVDRDSDEGRGSTSREVGRAVVDVPLERAHAHIRSLVAEVPGIATSAPRYVIWAVHREGSPHPVEPLVAGLARDLARRGAPFIFVVFDPAVDPSGNGRDVAKAIGARDLSLFFVLDRLDGDALRFATPFGDLIPALDRYAQIAGATHLLTTSTTAMEAWTWPGAAPYLEDRAVLISGTGGSADRRADAAAVIGYTAGRRALGAEELQR